jgi:tetratricopeptide (TPR) repeat protein
MAFFYNSHLSGEVAFAAMEGMRICLRPIDGAGIRQAAALVMVGWCTASPMLPGQEGTDPYQEGLAAFKKGNYAEAIAADTRAIELNPKLAKAYDNRGKCYFAEGSYSHARTDFTEVIALDPRDAEAYNNRGTTYYEEGDYDLALADYRRAVRLRPKFALASENQRRARLRQKDDPMDLLDRGTVASMKKHYGEAIAEFSEAIFLEPKFMWAHVIRAVNYAKNEIMPTASPTSRKPSSSTPTKRYLSTSATMITAPRATTKKPWRTRTTPFNSRPPRRPAIIIGVSRI